MLLQVKVQNTKRKTQEYTKRTWQLLKYAEALSHLNRVIIGVISGALTWISLHVNTLRATLLEQSGDMHIQ
jgi:hypothetical protein